MYSFIGGNALYQRKGEALRTPRCSRSRGVTMISTSATRAKGEAWLRDMAEYSELYASSLRDPDGFWSEVAKEFEWEDGHVPSASPQANLKAPGVKVSWFADARTNICHNALDRWVSGGMGDRACFICEGNEASSSSVLSYAQVLDRVQRAANALKAAGVRQGDRVVLYLPMIPDLPVTMLALARIGAVHVVVFAGFSAEALAARIIAAEARVVVTCEWADRASKTIPLKSIADDAIVIAAKRGQQVQTQFVVAAPSDVKEMQNVEMVTGRDLKWEDALKEASAKCAVTWVDAEDPLFVLYTSGSTGAPKGVVHTTGGYMVYAATTFKYSFDYHAEQDVFFCTADCGWITGHSYVTYGPLLNGATQILHAGTPMYPDAGRLWEIVERHKVTQIYTAPTAIRALMGAKAPDDGSSAEEWVYKHNTSSLRVLGTVGEPIGADAWRWYRDVVGGGRPDVRVVDTWWQTETGGHMISSLPLRDIAEKPGCAMLPFFGVQPSLVDDNGREVQGAGEGLLAIKAAWPGMLRTTLGDHSRMERTYYQRFPGVYLTGDGARRDEDGHYWLTGRADDVLNVSGHRVGTAEVEAAIGTHSAVAEAAVVGVPHGVKGEALYAYVALRASAHPCDSLRREIAEAVRREIGAFAAPQVVHWAPSLPKTRSGKIVRRVLRTIAQKGGRLRAAEVGDVSTIADPSVVETLIASYGK